MSNSPMFNERQVAEFLGVSLGAVRSWRLRKRGPAWHKVEGMVRYRAEDLEAYLAGVRQGAAHAGSQVAA